MLQALFIKCMRLIGRYKRERYTCTSENKCKRYSSSRTVLRHLVSSAKRATLEVDADGGRS